MTKANAQTPSVQKKTFSTDYVFDSFGRMTQMTYPDGEVLTYVYDSGGLLKEATGIKRGNRYPYVKSLLYDEFGQRTRIEYGNGVVTTYDYYDETRRLKHIKTVENAKKRVIQEIAYDYDLVGNINFTKNTAPIPAGGEIGGPTEQNFTYDDLYQLRTANGTHWPALTKRTSYTNSFIYDTIGNITQKVQTHLVIHGTDSATEPRETNYSLDYKYTGTQPHAVTDAGDRLYTYDLNGNMTGWTSKSSGQRRTIVWNEENRVKSIADQGSTVDFLYDDTGERAVKKGQYGETVYVNRFYSLKNGGLGSKHVFAGETRVVTKLEKDGGSIQSGVPGSIALVRSQGIYDALQQGNGQKKGIKRRLVPADGTTSASPPIEKFQFFYHGDHLGSSSFITDDVGAVYQHLEYFPYGETWVEDGGSGQMPHYRFTGKELDPETGLYYYGARYYDPVLSRWISADPILVKYLPTGNKRKDQNLPGHGGVFNSANLNLCTYSHNNPVVLVDPDGETVIVTETYLKTGVATAKTQPAGSPGRQSVTVPTYRVNVWHVESGRKWDFAFTRDATRGGVHQRGRYGIGEETPPGIHYGTLRPSGDGVRLQIYDPRISQDPSATGGVPGHVANPEDPNTPRTVLQHHGLGCSDGCEMSDQATEFNNLLQELHESDIAEGRNSDIIVDIKNRNSLSARFMEKISGFFNSIRDFFKFNKDKKD